MSNNNQRSGEKRLFIVAASTPLCSAHFSVIIVDVSDMNVSELDFFFLAIIFVDFSKAFDTLDHGKLLRIARIQGMPEKYCEIIRKVFEGAEMAIRRRDDKEEICFNQQRGIRQGSSLSPNLFVLIVNFVLEVVEESCRRRGMEGGVRWEAYADDIALVHNEVRRLEEVFRELQGAARYVGLKYN